MKRLISLVVAAGVAALIPVAGPTASALASTTLPLEYLRAMVVDEPAGKVFFSGAQGGDPAQVHVTDLAGSALGVVDGISSAGEMALSADGSQLYVADDNQIRVVDPATSAVVKTVDLGVNVCPWTLAPASGKVFFMYAGCSSVSGWGTMGAVDLTSGAVTKDLPFTGEINGGRLAAIPGQPDALVSTNSGTLAVLDTVGGLTPTASVRVSVGTNGTGYFKDAVPTPDGSQLVVAKSESGFQGFVIYNTSDLSVARTLLSVPGANSMAVAVRADGRIAVSWRDAYSYLRFYKPGSTTSFGTIRYGQDQMPSPIGFGSTYLYTVSRSSTSFTFRRVTPGPPAGLALTTDRSVYPLNTEATVVATLTGPTVNRTVSIYIQTAGATERLLKTGTVSATGRLVAKVPGMKRNTTFRAVFHSDGDYADASAVKSVKVPAKVTLSSSSTRVDGVFHLMKASPSPVVNGVVAPSEPYQSVRFTGSVWKDGRWSLYGSRYWRLSSTSRFSVAAVGFKPGQKLRFAVTFVANTLNASSPTAYYYVKLT